jgi:hypothetical protein
LSQLESGKVSYIRAFHEIEASPSAETLLAYASELLLAESFVDPRDPQKRVPRPNVYPASSLYSTVFEGYAPAGDSDTNELLRKLQYRLESPELEEIDRKTTNYGKRKTIIKDVENPLMVTLRSVRSMYLTEKADSQHDSDMPSRLDMMVSSSSIVVSTKEQYQGHGTQLALKLDESNVASFLIAESEAYITQARKIVFARRLAWIDNPEAAVLVPILSAPFRSENQTKEFIEQLSDKLPVVSLDVSEEVAWGNIKRPKSR